MSDTRIYKVNTRGEDAPRLVLAGTKAQAIRFVAEDNFEAEVADGKDIAQLVKDGIQVEVAGEEKEFDHSPKTEPVAQKVGKK